MRQESNILPTNGLRISGALLCVVFAALVYALLVFGTSCRSIQVLGLPLLGLLALAAVRWVREIVDQETAKGPWCLVALLGGLVLGIGVEAYALMRMGNRETIVHHIQADWELRDRIRSLIERGSWTGVVRLGKEVGSIRDPQVLLDIGYAHQQLDDLSQAKAYYHQAIKIDPANPAACYELARVYEKTNDLDSAAAQYRAALQNDDSLADIHLAYGSLLVRLGNHSVGKEHLEKAIALYPDDSPWKPKAREMLRTLRGGT